MSVRCISQVLEKSQHSGSELLMLVVLADYSDDDGNSYPSVASLARKCRMKRRNAQYILNVLQDSGELRIMKNAGPNGCNRYRIVLSALGAITPVQSTAPVQSCAPVQSSVGGGATQCAKPVQHIAPEPSLNRQRTVRVKRATSSIDSVLAEFGELLDGVDHDALTDWLKVRAEKRAKGLTGTAIKGLVREAGKLGLTLNQAIVLCVERNWISLQANWESCKPAAAAIRAGNALTGGRHPQWALDAGFANIDEAHNERCYERNAHEFRDGKRIEGTLA
jgi:hypothetical protein